MASPGDIDLILEALQAMDPWGTPPDATLLQQFFAKYREVSEEQIKEAVSQATKVQELVRATVKFYSEPHDSIRATICMHLRNGAPGLTDAVYSLAERRAMFMYIK